MRAANLPMYTYNSLKDAVWCKEVPPKQVVVENLKTIKDR